MPSLLAFDIETHSNETHEDSNTKRVTFGETPSNEASGLPNRKVPTRSKKTDHAHHHMIAIDDKNDLQNYVKSLSAMRDNMVNMFDLQRKIIANEDHPLHHLLLTTMRGMEPSLSGLMKGAKLINQHYFFYNDLNEEVDIDTFKNWRQMKGQFRDLFEANLMFKLATKITEEKMKESEEEEDSSTDLSEKQSEPEPEPHTKEGSLTEVTGEQREAFIKQLEGYIPKEFLTDHSLIQIWEFN